MVAAAAVLGGPALLIYARSDLGPWSWWPEHTLLSVPFGLLGTTAAGYVFVLGLNDPSRSFVRTFLAATGCSLVPLLTYLASGMLLGTLLGIACDPGGAAAASIILALPTAFLQTLALGVRRRFVIFEFLAPLVLTGGSLLIGYWLSGWACRGLADVRYRIFQDWPILLAAIPYVALAALQAKPVSGQRLALTFVLPLMPLYLSKALIDQKPALDWTSAGWPVRVWTDFVTSAEYKARIDQAMTIKPGVPFRFGKHWYKLDAIRTRNVQPIRARWPDRIAFLQITVPPTVLDLSEIPSRGSHIVNLHIVAASRRYVESDGYIGVREDDVIVQVWGPREDKLDREAVREKLRRFIRNARVDPPLAS